MEMKSLTINGQRFSIRDGDAVLYKAQNPTEEQQEQARKNIGASAAPEGIDYSVYFDIDYDGLVSLKPEYRGCPSKTTYPYAVSDNGVGVNGSKNAELPEIIVIPEIIDGTAVSGFQPGVFYGNEKVKEMTLPDGVRELPDYFCREATNLRLIHNTDNIEKIGGSLASYTMLQKLYLPNLKEVASGAFGACLCLYAVDIGNNISEIPAQMFMQCISLSLVTGGGNVTSIGNQACYITFNLKNLPFLSNVTSIGKNAFYKSRIQFDWSKLEGKCTFGDMATPVVDNTTDYWTGVETTPCEHRIVTVISQKNPEWKDMPLGSTNKTYYNGCAMLALLHIHSALSGNVYTHPDQFIEEVGNIDNRYITTERDPGKSMADTESILKDLGYSTKYYKTGTTHITKAIYEDMCAALARGAYVLTEVSTANDVHDGHVVVLYGINGNGEVLVLDSDNMCEKLRGVKNIDKFQCYRVPYQNITGPGSEIIIVEKSKEE